ncbi:hypothetical protein [uncultured Desulfobacter sp.]|uniref:hypothetical protein n=1 Tax=uncultured Desulfobacter sp. TaxID=240139 RepID=UPI0029F591A6|nr:hypothetical protein [uncultured Desulfobacter sp.]
MGRASNIINHPERLRLEQELLQNKNLSALSRKYQVSIDSLSYHKKHNLSESLARAFSQHQMVESNSLLDDINSLISRTKEILDKSEKSEKFSVSLNAIREIRESYKLLSQIAFSLAQQKHEEVILQQTINRELDDDDKKSLLKKITSRLTESELNLYLLLCQKIDGNPRLQHEITADNLDHASTLLPVLELENLNDRINSLCIREHQEYCRENNIEYENLFSKAPRQKEFKEGIKKLTAKPKTKKMKRRRVKAK